MTTRCLLNKDFEQNRLLGSAFSNDLLIKLNNTLLLLISKIIFFYINTLWIDK